MHKTSSTRRRNRACEECHRLKIKCDLSTNPGAACERCSRNNVECVPAAPRLQRDRISELEAQIQELQNVLRDQSSSSGGGSSSSTTPSWSPGSVAETQPYNILSFLDARIPLSKQQELLYLFAHQAGAAWPVIRLPKELDYIREKSPILLLSILVYSVTHEAQGTDLDVHDELVRETVHILGDEVIGKGQRSLELVQALLVAAFWSKSTRKGKQGSSYQIVQLAADMAIDLGIGGYSLQPSPAAFFCRHENPTSLEARRTWLASFVALSTSSISMRRPNAVPWYAHHQECLLDLENRGEPSDILLCQIVRITHLIDEISNHLCLCQLATFVDGNNYDSHVAIEILKSKVDAWAAQIPFSLASSQTLQIWRHVAMIHIYELVLHTPTNKASFAAPFIPGRIPVKDFPKPANIIPSLESALQAIVQHCHAVIHIAAEMDPALLLSLPAFSFTPIVLYALFVLVTTMVAATDPTNTYGQCLPRDCFRIEYCGLRLRSMTACMLSLDPTMSSFTTRFIDATSWLEEWYNDYVAILQQYEMNLVS
jgi:hypothetical protein